MRTDLSSKTPTVLSVVSEIIESLKIKITGTDFVHEDIYCVGDIVNVTYIEDTEILNVEGRVSKIKQGLMTIDSSKDFQSKVDLVQVTTIRQIEKLNHPVQPLQTIK